MELSALHLYRPVVYLVDDDPSIRDSLLLWLGFRNHPTRAFESAETFLEVIEPSCQGCAIVDMRMEGMDGLQLQQKLVQLGVRLPVIFLTAHGDVPTARSALKAGAFDFLEKPVDNDRLLELIQGALQRDEEHWQSNAQVELLRRRMDRLTGREREVMEFVVAGRHNREIAAQMGISARTVEVYKARLMDKLDVERTADLVRLALRLQDLLP